VAQVQRSFESICDSFLSLLAAVIEPIPKRRTPVWAWVQADQVL